jgi:hypothetical protein
VTRQARASRQRPTHRSKEGRDRRSREGHGGAKRHVPGGEREADAHMAGDLEKRGSGRSGHRRRPRRLEPCRRSYWEDRIYAIAGPAPQVVMRVSHHHIAGTGSSPAQAKTVAIAEWGPSPFSCKNGVWRVNFGAHPKLGALVGALLELCFFAWAPIFIYGGLSRGPARVALISVKDLM